MKIFPLNFNFACRVINSKSLSSENKRRTHLVFARSIWGFDETNSKSQKMKVFISRPDIPVTALDLLSSYDLDIWTQESEIPRDVFLDRVKDKDALFIHAGDKINAEVLDAAGNNLKVIATLSVGYDHIDVREVKKRGIKLGYTAVVLNDAVAEMAVALLLSASRRLFEGHNHIVQGTWKSWSRWDWMNGLGVKNSVVGIFGLGRIGLEIGKRILPFKPSKILYVARKPKEEAKEIRAVKVRLDDLLKESDFVIVSVALNEETRGILDEKKIDLMKPTAFIVNISRGGVINTDALVKALKEKKIGGAGLDVMTPEPLPKNHELLNFVNCSMTPHIGSAEISTRIEMAELTSRNIIAGLNGTALPMEIPAV